MRLDLDGERSRLISFNDKRFVNAWKLAAGKTNVNDGSANRQNRSPWLL